MTLELHLVLNEFYDVAGTDGKHIIDLSKLAGSIFCPGPYGGLDALAEDVRAVDFGKQKWGAASLINFRYPCVLLGERKWVAAHRCPTHSVCLV